MAAGRKLPFLVELKSDAAVGTYPVRVQTPDGVSNILLFTVGAFPEVTEEESKTDAREHSNDSIQTAEHIIAPVTVGGTLIGADRDYYAVHAKEGERLVFEVEARRSAGGYNRPATRATGGRTVPRQRRPYFSLVLCCEILEHLVRDPMHMMLEIHRILSPGGTLLLTTPNCAGLTCVANLLEGRVNPQVYSRYSRSKPDDPPHVREYTAYEVAALMKASGFETRQLLTDRIESRDPAVWVYELLSRNHLDTAHRGEQIYCLAVTRPELANDRYPAWLYD